MKKMLTVIMSAALVFSAVACSSDKKVGAGINVEKLSDKSKALGEIDEKKSGGGFVGEKEEADEEAAAAAKAKAAQDAAAQAEQQAAQKQEAAVKISITPAGYDPYYIRVFENGVVTFTNKDTVVRNVTADGGEFDSGDIAPGKSWTYEPPTAGKYNFHDESCVETRSGTCGIRKSTVGTLEVLPR